MPEGDGAGTGTGTGTGTGAGAGAGDGAGAGAGGGDSSWFSTLEGLTPETKTWVTNKNFESAAIALESHRNFEKLQGVPQERLVALPERSDDKEGWGKVFSKMGRPENAEGYGIKATEQNPASESFLKWAGGTFHEIGLSKAQGENLVNKWNDFTTEHLKGESDKTAGLATEQQAKLKADWGSVHDTNLNLARQAATGLGVSGEEIDQLQKVMGFDGVMKLFHNIGTKTGEHKFVGNDGGGSGFGGMTPEQARAKIIDLQKDLEFGKLVTAGNAEAKEKWNNLHKWAYPDM